MKIWNAASKPVVIRTFAGDKISGPNQFVMIDPGRAEIMYGPALPEFGLKGPYMLIGDVMVRDWGRLNIEPSEDMPSLVLRPGKSEIFKKPFVLNHLKFEGFFACYYDETHLIGL